MSVQFEAQPKDSDPIGKNWAKVGVRVGESNTFGG